jgi:hypothetical protein
LLSKAGRQSRNVLKDVDLGDVFGIQLDDIDAPLPDLPPVQPQSATTKKRTAKAQKTAAVQQSARARKKTQQRIVPPRTAAVATKVASAPVIARRALQTRVATAPPNPQQGNMLEALVKAIGKARKGKSVEQLQEKLGWTKMQVRNAISRANAKDLIETVNPGVYRQKV